MDQLTEWVNNNIDTISVVNISSREMSAEGYVVFYYEILSEAPRKKLNESYIRDMMITGSFMIGPNGKEPAVWKDYAMKLEKFICEHSDELELFI